jgi:arylsulfatase
MIPLIPFFFPSAMQFLRLLAALARCLPALASLAAFDAALAAGVAATPAARPNIVAILTDDMGYSDLGCYGGEIATPNLDALAAGGVRFTQFYNSARCCPTRAALLTGLYPHQAGVGHMMEDRGFDAYRGDLNRRNVTLAEALKPAGYRAYAVGKWHVTPGGTKAALERRHNWPLQRGFDRFYGTIHGAGSYWDPSALVRDNREITGANDPEYRPKEFYYTDAISDHATRFIGEHARDHARAPFLLYVAYTAAHWPMHARESDIAKYRGRYDAGYAAIRAARWEKGKRLGVVNPAEPLPPPAEDWAAVTNREFETRCMEVYAAMVEVMDQGVGRIVAELKSQGQFDNTLICFLQDNGGCAETNGRVGAFQPRADRPTLAPMALDTPQISSKPDQTRDGWPVRQGYGVLPGPADTYIAYGRGWANVSNTPFREYKHWIHEGGISTPLIVHWPLGIPAARRGRLEAQPGHLIDLMATCVDIAGAKYPAEFKGQAILPMEGVSLRPALAGEALARAQPLCWEHEGNRAIRVGPWKLVSKFPGVWELYNIDTDRNEQHDLVAQQPERVKQMAAQYEAWAQRVGVQPWTTVQPAAAKKADTSTTAPAKGKKKKAANDE